DRRAPRRSRLHPSAGRRHPPRALPSSDRLGGPVRQAAAGAIGPHHPRGALRGRPLHPYRLRRRRLSPGAGAGAHRHDACGSATTDRGFAPWDAAAPDPAGGRRMMEWRDRLLARLVTAVILLIAAPTLRAAPAGSAAAAPGERAARRLQTRNVILVTLDGLRIQEMFAGMDEVISQKEKRSGIYDLERARARYWRDTAEERRLALWPFFWGSLAGQGVVLGDKGRGSSVQPRNPYLFSAPGYAEILTGQ